MQQLIGYTAIGPPGDAHRGILEVFGGGDEASLASHEDDV